MSLRLRPYQTEAIEAITRDWNAGLTDVLLVAATGAGKTVIFLELLNRVLDEYGDPFWPEPKRGLILAHRRELIDQPLERIAALWPEWLLRTGVVMAEQNECDRQLTVASVQTLIQPGRIERLLEHGAIDYVVVDECHHANARTYLEIISQLKEANPKLRHLGVTATPLRSDGDGLKRVYQKVSYKAGIKELIKLGHLVPFKALAVSTAISLKYVKEVAGDFVQKQLADVWECDNLYDLIVESHRKYAKDRPAMVFTVSVEGAHRLAERFNRAGISAAAADGSTAKGDRRDIVEGFKRGDTQVLCNCALWTEGLDLPKIACVHMARPTKSDLVYVQAMGRGLRPLPGKEDCLILDYCPVDARNIVMAGDLLGKPRQQKKVEEKAQQAGVVIEGFSFTGEGTGIDGDPDELVTRPLNYLSTSPFAWFFNNGLSTLGLGTGEDKVSRTLAIITPNGHRNNRLVLIQREEGSWRDDVMVIGEASDFAELADQGAEYAEEHGVGVLTGRDKAWQKQPITPKQRDLLIKLTGKNSELATLSKGQAARLITHEFARKALRRAGL